MAAAPADSLGTELECAICSDQLKQPKYIGSCTHTFCKECIDKYWVSLEKRRTIPCPQCREECPIPSNGVDDLKDNFMVTNIIETYRKQQQKAALLTEIKCTLCPNGASCFCKDCDLKLCPECKRNHDRNPQNHDHHLFRLCRSHGNGLLFFCNPCKQAVCGGCRLSDHKACNHEVTPSRQVAINLISRIQACSAELEDAIRTQLGNQETKLSGLRDIVQQQSTSAEKQATVGTENNIAKNRKDIRDHQAKSQTIQKKIDILLKKKEKEDEITKQLVKDVDKLEKEKAKIIASVREKFTKSSEKINLRLRSLETRRQEMNTKIEQGRAVGSTKITIDTESIANLTSISQELVDLVGALRDSDTVAVIEEVTRSIGKTKQDFRQLKKVCNFPFPGNQLRRIVYRLKHLPDSRLATLAHSSGGWGSRLATLAHSSGGWGDTIYFHDEVSSSLTGTITEGVYPAQDMALTSTGEVVVARLKEPPIRVFKPATGAYRDINIAHDGKVIVELWSVETDESDNMFALTSLSNSFLLVVKPNGTVIQCIRLTGPSHRMGFCSLNRTLYIAACDRILRFHWSNNILEEISSCSHGVEGFLCNYVCIGSGGEVLVAGWMRHGDIGIYQVTEGEDEEDMVWREIKYQDGEKRTIRNLSHHICINYDNLWLAYNDKFEKFKLV
ncbi:uncharacterized protein LOC135502726 [Lineus longissimus]|uniref:uncharacterized protein LOC135502726 n=1 Tax=Lineus longissimus TaxID=88925 RepID=UPI00315C61BE